MKNLSMIILGFIALIVFAVTPVNKANAQASIPADDYYLDLEWCYCGELVIKCRLTGIGACDVSSQIPCVMACGD